MKPNEVEHEIMRRDFWCNVYLKYLNDGKTQSKDRIACSNEALDQFDERFKTLPESVKPYINTGPK